MPGKIYQIRMTLYKGKGKGNGKGKIYKDLRIHFPSASVVFDEFSEKEETWKLQQIEVIKQEHEI